MAQRYKITTDSGKTFYAEVPDDKKLRSTLDGQIKIWYENIEGSKYRGRGIDVGKTKELPPKGVHWLSFHSSFLENKKPKKVKEFSI
jgi:hypothetical protein